MGVKTERGGEMEKEVREKEKRGRERGRQRDVEE